MSTRIILADDHCILREGIGAMLREVPDFAIVGEAGDGNEAVRLARELRPDVVVTDVSMPGMNGIEAIRRIVAEVPGVKTLCLSVHDEKRLVSAVMDAGACGYLLKDCAFDELLRAVRTVLAGKVWISPSIAGVLMEDYRNRRAGTTASAFSELTAREREVIQLIAEGCSTREIAERLHVSAKTIGTHREHLMTKLGVSGTAELTRYALREGLTALEGHSATRPARTRRV